MDFNKSFYELCEEEYDDMDIAEWYDTYKKYKKLEEEIGCPLDIAHSVQPGKIVCVLFPDKHIYRCMVDKVSYFGFTLSGEPDSPGFIYFKQYKQTWWLKEDRSE